MKGPVKKAPPKEEKEEEEEADEPPPKSVGYYCNPIVNIFSSQIPMLHIENVNLFSGSEGGSQESDTSEGRTKRGEKLLTEYLLLYFIGRRRGSEEEDRGIIECE